jgi:hypothetical protein
VGDVTIEFNICHYTFNSCPDGDDVYATIVNENNTCNKMSTEEISDVGVSLIDTQNPESGLKLLYQYGDKCNDTHKYTLTV